MCINIYDSFYQGALNRAFSLYGASSWHNVLRAIDYNIDTYFACFEVLTPSIACQSGPVE